jgi:hypothetical protein
MSKKRLSALVIAVTVLASATVIPARAEEYSDVPSSHWAYQAVTRCSAAHWFSGYPDGTFKPDGEILRSEAMKVFVQILGLPLSEVTNSTYYDVSPTAWYAPYVEAGKSLFPSRLALDGQAKFQPEMPITREDAAYALVMALGYGSEVKFVDESVLNMFSDQKSISTNVRPYLAWAVSDGMISGYSDGTIGAQEPLTRAQFCTMLYRANMTHGFNNYVGTVSKVVSGVTINPSTLKEVNVGESFEVEANISYTDGTSVKYTTELNPYTEGTEGIIEINRNKITAKSAGSVIVKFNNDELKDISLVVNVKSGGGNVNTQQIVPSQSTQVVTPSVSNPAVQPTRDPTIPTI